MLTPSESSVTSAGDPDFQSPRESFLHKLIWGTLTAAVSAGAVAIATHLALVLLANWHPAVELAVHFSFHALVAAACLLPIAWLLRKRWTATVVGVATAYLLLLVQPWSLLPWAGGDAADAKYANQIAVLSWNLLSRNGSFEEVEQLVASVNPEILILIEVRPGLLDDLPAITSRYRTTALNEDWQGGGIAVLSRIDNVHSELESFGYPSQPAIVASLHDDGGRVLAKIVAMHTFSPMPISRTPHRDKQLERVREWAADQSVPHCLVGDLNTTPWSRSFGQLLRAGYRDSRIGCGNGPSWPAALGALGIPIDHALAFGECRIDERRVLAEAPGSDHRPIVFQFSY